MEIVRDAWVGLFGVALILDTCKIKLQAMATLGDAPRSLQLLRSTANAYLIKTLILQ